jgi:hypothetical protein
MNPQMKARIEKSLGPFVVPLYFGYLLFDDLKSWRSFPTWFKSFRAERSLLDQATPWIPFEASHWLEKYLRPDMKVFEYGSGGSTIFFCERVGQLFSVEHEKRWYWLVSKALEQRALTNCLYQLQEPYSTVGMASPEPGSEIGGPASPMFIFDERESDYPRMSFDKYVNAIDDHPDDTFDLVFVDGRARRGCINRAIPKVRHGGYLMLDNSNNADIAECVRKMQRYPRLDFRGIAPGWPPARWTTTTWQISD